MTNIIDFDGETYDRARDHTRLTKQLDRVRFVMEDGRWHSLENIAGRVKTIWGVITPEASVSARIRDLRKPKFGGFHVERRNLGRGLWMYRLRKPEESQADWVGK